MSDTIYKIFPRFYSYSLIYSDEKIIGAVNILNSYSQEKITFTNYNSVRFIDCGEGLKHIFCPWCGREFHMEQWQGMMNEAYKNNAFEYLGLRLPCCKSSSSLDELIYVKPCGFATFVIEVFNPIIIPCVVELDEMGKCFGHPKFFKMISAHI